MKPVEGRKRVIIEVKSPTVDCGRYPARRFLGDEIKITAAVFGDGHDRVSGKILFRHESERRWRSASLVVEGNDIFSATFPVDKLGNWKFAVQGWVNHFGTWCYDLKKRLGAQPVPGVEDSSKTPQDIPLALRSGALLLEQAAKRAKGHDAMTLSELKLSLEWMADQNAQFYENPVSDDICELADRYTDPDLMTRSEDFPLWVDRERARYSTWYELFPRSASFEPGKHGTFKDVERRLPAIAAMGFDVLYNAADQPYR